MSEIDSNTDFLNQAKSMFEIQGIPAGTTLAQLIKVFAEDHQFESGYRLPKVLDEEFISEPVNDENIFDRVQIALESGLFLPAEGDHIFSHENTVELDPDGVIRIDVLSFLVWLMDEYVPEDHAEGIQESEYNLDTGVGSLNYERFPNFSPLNSQGYPVNAKWEDFKIIVRSNYRLEIRFKSEKGKIKSFSEVGLTNESNNLPNQSARLLVKLAYKGVIPPGVKLDNKVRTSLTRLSNTLKDITGLTDSPFTRRTKERGMRPKFILIDDQRNAENRVKDKAIKVDVDVADYFNEKDIEMDNINDGKPREDNAAKWLKDNS